MEQYKLQIKQIVDYPRCRIYRQFIRNLIEDRSIRCSGSSGLFWYVALCSYANFRTSYRRIDGINYTVYPGEWICTLKELSQLLRTKYQREVIPILDQLQSRNILSYTPYKGGTVIKYRILDWRYTNTVLDYNCPCQKDTGFFFISVAIADKLISYSKCSEMDIVLDLWVSTIYNDPQVQGSDIGPVVYFRNGTGSPLLNCTELSARWSISRATVSRILKHLTSLGFINVISFPGRTGSVIYLENYLSTMFQISDVLIDKQEVAMVLHIQTSIPYAPEEKDLESAPEIIVPESLVSVSKHHIAAAVCKLRKILDTQGLSCIQCEKIKYKLFTLSDDCLEDIYVPGTLETTVRFGVTISCGEDKLVRTFAVSLSPITGNEEMGC